jgi:DNA polymerase-3 subunit epsilon
MYAILDIETTGGKFDEEGITEIAIFKFDGHQIIDRFISLVNPERDIQPFVVKLTGINSGMLEKAPKFYEIAKQIIDITEGCVLVAHNAVFDNRILTTEFRRLGYNYEKSAICTVELSQKLIPDLPSYKLGKLCRSLGIPVSSRHRAEGDAIATVQLFKHLLEKDTDKTIISEAAKKENPRKLAPKLQGLLDELPNKKGVFYIHNAIGKVIYIGKGNNLKKSATQLFLRTSNRARLLQKQAISISYDETGNELITRLKYTNEIIANKPKFNRIKRINNVANVKFNNESFLLVEKGRTVGEKAVLLIENNQFKGYCFTELSHQINNLTILKSLITPMKNSNFNRKLIKNYLQKNTVKKIIRL